MARPNALLRSFARVRDAVRLGLARALVPELKTRGFDAASWKRFPQAAKMGRASQEVIMARALAAMRGTYYYGSDTYTHAGVNAAVTYGWGAGAVCAHPNAAAFELWGLTCDADGLLPFDALFGMALREMIVTGECLIVFVQRSDGLKLRLLPASQLDESLSRDLGNGSRIDAGIETNADGVRTAYWIMPTLPSTQFESYAPPIRIAAEDVVHLFKPMFVGQTRGLSWLTPAMLKLADTSALADALLKGAAVSALNSTWLIKKDGSAGLPFSGEQSGDKLEDLSREPGSVRLLYGEWEHKSDAPQQAQGSIEFLHAQINAIAASLGVCAFMVSGDVSRANYSSLRADLLKMKASVESWQWSTLVPALNAIWRRFSLVESLRGSSVGDELPTWRFQKFPEADPVKAIAAVREAMAAKIMSRREAIEERGEDPDAVTAEIASDQFPEAYTTGAVAAPADEETEDSNDADSNDADEETDEEDSNAPAN